MRQHSINTSVWKSHICALYLVLVFIAIQSVCHGQSKPCESTIQWNPTAVVKRTVDSLVTTAILHDEQFSKEGYWLLTSSPFRSGVRYKLSYQLLYYYPDERPIGTLIYKSDNKLVIVNDTSSNKGREIPYEQKLCISEQINQTLPYGQTFATTGEDGKVYYKNPNSYQFRGTHFEFTVVRGKIEAKTVKYSY